MLTKRMLLWMVALVILHSAAAAEKIPKATRIPAPASDSERTLIKEGVSLHDAGDYDGAIARYKAVLAANPDAVLAIYELAYSYFLKKDYENALATGRRAAEYKSDLLPRTHSLIGSALDDMGKREEAIDTYKAAIKQAPDFALLHYNLALSLVRSGQKTDARRSLQKALVLDPNHPTSHMLLGNLYKEEGYRIPAILAFSRFLVLEPASPRAQGALEAVNALLTGNVTKGEKPNQINITLGLSDKNKDEGDFGAAEVAMSISVAAAAMGEDKKSSAFKGLAATYGILASLMQDAAKKRKGFAAAYYAPYFAEMDGKGHTEAFVYHAWQSGRVAGAEDWVKENQAKLAAFQEWTKGYRWTAK